MVVGKSLDEVKSISNNIIGMNLITPQTSAQGKKVHQVLIAEDVYYPGESETSEFYMSVHLIFNQYRVNYSFFRN